MKNEHLYFYKSHTDDAGARRSVRPTGGAETRAPGQRRRQTTVEICIRTHTVESINGAGSIPFLMNFSSEERWARRRSISPITFLRGVHSHGAPGKANMQGLQHIYACSPKWIHPSGSDLLDKLGIPPGSPLGPGSPMSPFSPEIKTGANHSIHSLL